MTGMQGAARTVTRRTVVAAAGAVGLGAALVACGDTDSDADTAAADSKPEEGGAAGGVLAKTADIPEGGGKVFESQGVVVTQPKAGEFKAFSSTCTHQGCAVKNVKDGIIHCPCHGSQFSAEDGSVKGGPAPKPLPSKQITVEGDAIRLA